MEFLVTNYSCLQNPWLRGYRPQIPVLSVLNWICWTPPEKDSWVRHWWLGYRWTSEQNHDSFPIKHPDQGLGATCSSQWVLGTISLVHEVDHSFSNVTSLCVSLALSWVMCRDNFVCFFLYIINRGSGLGDMYLGTVSTEDSPPLYIELINRKKMFSHASRCRRGTYRGDLSSSGACWKSRPTELITQAVKVEKCPYTWLLDPVGNWS